MLSAVLSGVSTAARAFELSRYSHQLLVSTATLSEASEVFKRPRFDRYLSHREREIFLSDYASIAEIVDEVPQITVCRDPKDDKFLALAAAGGAAYLLTGDQDLLVHHPFGMTQIVSPADFLKANLP